jgi:hypothetical protein
VLLGNSPTVTPGLFPRWANESSSVVLVKRGSNNALQTFRYDSTTGANTELCPSTGCDTLLRATPQMWTDLTYGTLYGYLVRIGVVNPEYRIYRASDNALFATIRVDNDTLTSVEHFVYGGKSYVYFVAASSPLNENVWVASVTPQPRYLRVSDGTVMHRAEPEAAFPAGGGTPVIYYSGDATRTGAACPTQSEQTATSCAVWRSTLAALP